MNYPTLPLATVDNSELEPQYCYLPLELPTSATKNEWSKCVLNDGSFSVCRIARRMCNETCCFLDGIVASSAEFSAHNKRLIRIETLQPVASVEKLACVVTIVQEASQMKLTDLQQHVRIFLRYLTLINGCSVQHKRLLEVGISSIEIFEVPGLSKEECFEVTAETNILIVDIRLAMPAASVPIDVQQYLKFGFEKPMNDLEDLLRTAQTEQGKSFPLNALIVGAVGAGKSTLLAEFIRRHQCNCFYIAASQVIAAYPGETEENLRKIFESAHTFQSKFKPLLPVVILIEDLELLCPVVAVDSKNASNSLRISAQLYKVIDELPSRGSRILCLATTSAPDSLNSHARRAGRFANEIIIEMPTSQQREQLFDAYFRCHWPANELSATLLEYVGKQTQGYVVADISLLIRSIENEMLLRRRCNEDDNIDTIVHRALQQCPASASRTTDVRVLKMSMGFDSIGGMSALKRTLQVSVLAGLRQSAAFARFGLSLPKGVLLYGPPGCAKTTIAKCLAKEAHMTFIATSAAEVYSPYVGCAERFISRIFDTARKNAPCLIFLDEIDSLVGRRTISNRNGNGGGGGSGDVQLRILSTLLTEMDGIVGNVSQQHILVVAATNRPDMIDDALIRPGRFDKLIHVPAPDQESRLALLQLHAQRMPFADSVNLEEIAASTDRFSGADLCNLCNEAAIEAINRDFDVTSIEVQDFQMALAKQKSSLTQNQIDSYYKFAYKFL